MKKIILLIIITVILSSCEYIESFSESEDQYNRIPSFISSIADFKVGSYWIYYNDSLEMYDTIKVTDYEFSQYYHNHDDRKIYWDNIYIEMISCKGDTFHDYLSYDDYSRYKNGNRIYKFTNHNTYISFEDSPGKSFMEYKIDMVASYDTSIYRRDSAVCYVSDDNKNKYYFVENIGLVKSSIADSVKTETWNLVKYNIVR